MHESIPYDILIWLLAYVAEQIELHTHTGNVSFKLVTPAVTWYNIVSLNNILGTNICKALPFFFALTGCDTVLAFHGKGECTFWDQWMKSKAKEDLTRNIIALGRFPCSISNNDINTLETLVKSVYLGNSRNVKTSCEKFNLLLELQMT